MNKRAWLLLSMLVSISAPLGAQSDDVGQAKAFFKAGAAAYEAGDYQAAIQALDAAYRSTPLPAIAFSLAQAERRQYFVSHERVHLDRAIELFRAYLAQVPTGGRRADATDALAQLEPLALAASASTSPPAGAPGSAETARTRLLVTSEAPHATVALDGAAPVASPLIAEVTPGQHAVKVEARGYYPVERGIVAVAGALVPVEVPLRVRPAVVAVAAPAGADLYIDGRFVSKAEKATRLELPGGAHTFTLAKKGHRLKTLRVELEPGETRRIESELEVTSQRTAAYVTLGASGVSLGASVVFGLLAFGQENKANDIREAQLAGNIDANSRDEYDEALDRRGQFRAAAVVSGLVFAGTLVTGLCLHEFDQPDVHDAPAPQKGQHDAGSRGLALVDGPGDAGAAVRVTF